ncbi:MAG: hypothetical protein ABJA35_12420 [Parafilimonas sp.]
MKNWRLAYKVTFINCAIVVFIGIIVGLINAAEGFGFALGLVCLAGGLIDFFLALIIYLSRSKELAKGFLVSGGILLLLSGISCGTGLANTNFNLILPGIFS